VPVHNILVTILAPHILPFKSIHARVHVQYAFGVWAPGMGLLSVVWYKTEPPWALSVHGLIEITYLKHAGVERCMSMVVMYLLLSGDPHVQMPGLLCC
jgi:hypothetical protein